MPGEPSLRPLWLRLLWFAGATLLGAALAVRAYLTAT